MSSSIAPESWTWYAFVVLIIVARFASRIIQQKSTKAYRPEDGLMLVVLVFYTVLIVLLNKVEQTKTNLMTAEDIANYDPSTKAERVRGSKLVVATEQSWCIAVWGVKGCMLLLFSGLTNGLRYNLAVKIVSGYVIGSFILMEILFFGAWCRPFHNYWSVPPKNPQCDTYHDHLVFNLVFNVSSDLMIMAIPIPLLVRAKLPLQKKSALFGVFSLCLFTILCAVLSKFYSFLLPYGTKWVSWYVREVSTAIIVANIPYCWAIARYLFGWTTFIPKLTISRNAQPLDATIRGTTVHGNGDSQDADPAIKVKMTARTRDHSTIKTWYKSRLERDLFHHSSKGSGNDSSQDRTRLDSQPENPTRMYDTIDEEKGFGSDEGSPSTLRPQEDLQIPTGVAIPISDTTEIVIDGFEDERDEKMRR